MSTFTERVEAYLAQVALRDAIDTERARRAKAEGENDAE